MAQSPYFNSITSKSALRARYEQENGKAFATFLNPAASYWGRPHLFACRVLRQGAECNLLPVLSPFANNAPSRTLPVKIKDFLRGPEWSLLGRSEHLLVRGSNCIVSLAQIWAAMAAFKWNQDRRAVNIQDNNSDASEQDEEMGDRSDSEPDSGEPTLPQRSRQQVHRPGFVGSASYPISSSPPRPASISDQSVTSHNSLGYVDRTAHHQAITPEDDTLRLASCVIRHILYFAPPQDQPLLPKIVEFRDAKTRTATKTERRRRSVLAIDDGGLCLREQIPDGSFRLIDNHVAMLEAKTQFQSFDEDGRPTISDKALGQMVCEALAARLAYRNNPLLKSSIVIHATQNYMCFLQINLSDEYMADLEVDEPDHMLNVSATRWFDLNEKSGRQGVLDNLMAIMRRAING